MADIGLREVRNPSEAFLEERGPLLPDDERMLAELWLLAERTLWEIEEVRPGSGFTARDLRTGERVDVRERSASRQIGPGELVCARFVPAGDTVQCFGGLLSVPFVMRDRLLSLLDRQPPPAELVAMLSPAAWSHQVANTEGHPMVLCRTVLRTSDPAALAELLDGAYSRDDDGLPVWRELVDVAGGAQLRATLELRDDLVTVETNSEQRQDRVLADLRERQPGLEVVEEERTPVDDLRQAMRRAPAGSGEPAERLDPADPAVVAVLEQVIRQHEQAWLDEQIPALGGVTPREAAADPTRRPDLLRLLDSFPAEAPGQMSAARLRAALGL